MKNRFWYTNDLELSSTDAAIQLLPVVRRCGPVLVIDRIFDYLFKSITCKNVVSIAEVAHEYKNKRTLARAINFIATNASKVLASPSFGNLCLFCVEKIIKADDIKADELLIYHAVQYWAQRECERTGLDPTPENLRKVLGSVLYEIRFPVINFQQIKRDFSIFKALLESERKALYMYNIGKIQTLPYYFNNTHRKFHELNNKPTVDSPIFSRASASSKTSSSPSSKATVRSSRISLIFSSSSSQDSDISVCDSNKILRFAGLTGPWTMTHPETLSFRCSRTIIMTGIMMFGAYGSSERYTIEMTVTQNGNELYREKSSVSSEKPKPEKVQFKEPVTISRNVGYEIKVSMESKPTYIGVEGIKCVEVNKTKFTFFDNGNDVTRGQIPGLLFRNILNDEIC